MGAQRGFDRGLRPCTGVYRWRRSNAVLRDVSLSIDLVEVLLVGTSGVEGALVASVGWG